MSTPSNGPQYDGPNQGPQYGGGQPGGYGGQGQSLGQGYDQGGYNQGGYGQGGYGPSGGPGGQGSPQGGPGGAPQHKSGGAGGVGELFTDFGFTKSLTEKLASLAFIVTVVWAVLNFIRVLASAWGSSGDGQFRVRNMGGFEAMMTTLEGLAWMVFVVVIARLLLELCVHVARLARDKF